ncbi:hypothetical protein C7974DRAFT_450209 [Boeremia exigua]|uniref:uncharacterized protein n=1 Tax=Boeremia exigua TaxID=749465 RepID=UPI001E8E96A1|nr:uncharacterized protein C7974DRAFT_450209 [Boeremia exigua]KAH6639890.1 hypothetical protein C7974DRAFT_450209 [Boeremia exigua]
MRFSWIPTVVLWSSFFRTTVALPSPRPSTAQNGLLLRKEWRSLSGAEKTAYISAVKCLLEKPPVTSKIDLPGVQNRFEDFLGDHIRQADAMHFVGYFYPWHRLLLRAYELELAACGYAGGQPYWDWSLDANSSDDFFNSPIFDPITGFGGNGDYINGTKENPLPGVTSTLGDIPVDVEDRSGGGCLSNGPFANLSIHMGPGFNTSYNEWCIRRDFVPSVFMAAGHSTAVDAAMSHTTFGAFSQQSEATNHGAGHIGVGGLYGVLTDVWASPGDPLFFLHHANMDRLWWSWQHKNLTARLTDISGPVVPHDYSNLEGRNVTLDDVVYVGTTVNVTASIRQLMDIRGPALGYTYADLY